MPSLEEAHRSLGSLEQAELDEMMLGEVTGNETMRFTVKVIIHIIGATILSLFAVIVFGNVFSNGLCCGDDSMIAGAAKNLAFGAGYSNAVREDNNRGLANFDPSITTGPTLVIPVAVLIRTVGNVPWAPGFITAMSSLAMMILVYWLICRIEGSTRAVIYLSILIFFLYSITGGIYFAQWFALLGEVPAAFLCIIGAVCWANSPDKRSAIVLGALLYGLAFLTKMLALLGFVPLAGWLVARIFFTKETRKAAVVDCFAGMGAFLFPSVLFEILKVSLLGIDSYAANLNVLLFNYIPTFGAPRGTGIANMVATLPRNWAAASATLSEGFGFSIAALLLAALLVAGLVYSFTTRPFARNLFAMLIAGAFVHFLWWVFLSIGWPRYAFIGLFLYFAAIACAVFVQIRPMIHGVVLALLVVVFRGSYDGFIWPIRTVLTNQFGYAQRLTNLLQTVAFLQQHETERPFVRGTWQSVVELEYALPTVDNFIYIDRVTGAEAKRGLLLVRNEEWLRPMRPWPAFEQWEQRCNEVVFKATPYLVTRCPPEAS